MAGLICAICPTFNRPELLGRAIRAFEKQTYQDRFMVIVDDLGQYENQSGDRWQLISLPERFTTLGEKRNYAASLAPPNTWAYAVWDDDDLYMPWHLEALAEALTRGHLVQPRQAVDFFNDEWVIVDTVGSMGKLGRDHYYRYYYHGCWGFTKVFFDAFGGYPSKSLGDDQDFQKKWSGLVNSVGTDPKYPPSYFYNRPGTVRISETGRTDKEYWEHTKFPHVGKVPKWTDESVWDREIPTKIIQRPWK